MEPQKPKIAMYAKRPFGEKLNASFDFIKENWKPLLKYSTYLVLPLSLVQALSLNGVMSGALNLSELAESGGLGTAGWGSVGAMFFVNYIISVLLYMVGMIVLCSLIYALIKKYNESEERLQSITMSEIKPLLICNVKKLLILTLVGIGVGVLVFVLMGLLAALTLYSMLFTIPLLFACCIPLALWAPIYLFEDISVFESLKKTFRLGFATWGGVFLVSFIMGLIGSVLQGVTMTPWYIATLVKYVFAVSDTGNAVTVSAGYNFLLYVLGIIQTYGAYLSMIFTFIGLAYQYGHASEVVDSITVENDIDNFDKL